MVLGMANGISHARVGTRQAAKHIYATRAGPAPRKFLAEANHHPSRKDRIALAPRCGAFYSWKPQLFVNKEIPGQLTNRSQLVAKEQKVNLRTRANAGACTPNLSFDQQASN